MTALDPHSMESVGAALGIPRVAEPDSYEPALFASIVQNRDQWKARAEVAEAKVRELSDERADFLTALGQLGRKVADRDEEIARLRARLDSLATVVGDQD